MPSNWLVYKFLSKFDEILILGPLMLMVFKWLIYVFKAKRNLFFLVTYRLLLVN